MMNLIKCKKTTTIAVLQSTELSPLFFLEKIYYVMFDEYETWGCSTDLECDITSMIKNIILHCQLQIGYRSRVD